MNTPNYTITMVSTFTAEPVRTSLAFWLKKLDLSGDLLFAPFNQVFQQLLDPASLFSVNINGLNVILLRLEDWAHPELTGTQAAFFNQASIPFVDAPLAFSFQQDIKNLALILKSGVNRSTPCLLCICPPSAQVLADVPLALFFQQMEEYLTSELAPITGVHLVRPVDLLTLYPVDDYHEHQAGKLGSIPYTPAFFIALGTMIARRMHALRRPPYKVIVLDCDQTLWKGICGEGEDPLHVEIDPARKQLQEFMVDQYNNGMLLCLCSKNNSDDVLKVFNQHPDMILKLEHILTWRINWDVKSANLYSLAEELHLGLDSFIFIDDDPVMCAEIRANCSQVLVLKLPQEDVKIPLLLQHTWAFDHLKATNTDAQRTLLYRQNLEREQLQKEAPSLADFLADLKLQVQIIEVSPESLARVSQLTQRTNQFNMTTIRRTEQEIEALIQARVIKCWTVSMTDRFGDYGLVGVMLFSLEADALLVDTFLLSCRALGRRVEHKMLAWLGLAAQEHHLHRVKFPFIPTAKNQPALEFLDSLKCDRQQFKEGGFIFEISSDVAAAI